MQRRRSLVNLLALGALLLGCVSCVVVTGWPPLPPTTYHGLVVDQLSRPVEGAEVVLCRRDKFLKTPLNNWLEDTDEEMAKTYTDREGKFVVTTRAGYATYAAASAPIGRGANYRGQMAGSVGSTSDGKRALPKELLLKLSER